MVWKTIGHQRISAHIAARASWNSHGLLPDRPRIRDFEDPGAGVEKFSQIREVDIRAHMIGAEFVDGIERRKIDLAGDSLPGYDSQRWLSICTAERRDRLFLTARDLKAQPGLPFRVVKFNVASGQICDGNRRDDRFVSNVLQSLEFQVDLDLRFCCGSKKKNTKPGKNASKIVGVAPSGSDASNTASKQSRHRAEGLFKAGNCCKSRDGSA
ncbi:MAG: hypothetical protein Udaeo_14090 [Candidatus Udaeobacter sp.]|nr:MAG: hypothetical protein Udaeo_14090 [Candidatus Udaeobacter sp.]